MMRMYCHDYMRGLVMQVLSNWVADVTNCFGDLGYWNCLIFKFTFLLLGSRNQQPLKNCLRWLLILLIIILLQIIITAGKIPSSKHDQLNLTS